MSVRDGIISNHQVATDEPVAEGVEHLHWNAGCGRVRVRNRLCHDQRGVGKCAGSVPAEKLLFREHFAKQLGGTSLPFSDLLKKDLNDIASPKCCEIVSPNAVVECLPGVSEVLTLSPKLVVDPMGRTTMLVRC